MPSQPPGSPADWAFPALHHVQLAVPRDAEEACRAFWRDLLGMAEVAKPPVLAARGGCWFRGGGLEVHLGVEEPFEPARKAHPGILVRGLPALASRLEAAGIAVTWDDEFPGHERFYAPDPFGNRLEFLEPSRASLLRDLDDDEARRALPNKWGSVPPDVLPAWVAEMDFALPQPVTSALQDAVRESVAGYPRFGAGGLLGEAYAGFAARHWDHAVDPEHVLPVSDVTAGIRLALDVLGGDGPLVLPVPAYPPQLLLADVTGRRMVTVPLDPDADEARLDVDGIDAALAEGGGTVLLTQPHNPLGRAHTRAELEALRDVVAARGARVISDEIHAPLVLPGARHVPYLSLPGTADHAVAVVAASKAFGLPGLRCAQIVAGDDATRDRLLAVPVVRNDSWGVLGVVASVAAYTACDDWLAALLDRLDAQRTLLTKLLEDQLPLARNRRPEATYLAWLDLRAYGHEDPAALLLERGRVALAAGHDFHPGLTGHVRLNLGTSPARLEDAVRRMAGVLG
jgi:cystathionine beta-lyase